MNKIAFQSHDLKLLKSLQHAFPAAHIIFLSKIKRTFPWITKPSNSSLLNKLNENNISTVSLKGRNFIDKHFIRGFKDSGIKVLVWNINDLSRIDYYKKIGIDGVITDKIYEYKHMIER